MPRIIFTTTHHTFTQTVEGTCNWKMDLGYLMYKKKIMCEWKRIEIHKQLIDMLPKTSVFSLKASNERGPKFVFMMNRWVEGEKVSKQTERAPWQSRSNWPCVVFFFIAIALGDHLQHHRTIPSISVSNRFCMCVSFKGIFTSLIRSVTVLNGMHTTTKANQSAWINCFLCCFFSSSTSWSKQCKCVFYASQPVEHGKVPK